MCQCHATILHRQFVSASTLPVFFSMRSFSQMMFCVSIQHDVVHIMDISYADSKDEINLLCALLSFYY